jgi:N-methylhydantoinase A
VSIPQQVARLDWAEACAVLADLKAQAEAELQSTGVDMNAITWSLVLEMRYAGQGNTVSVSLPYGEISPELAGPSRDGFEANYKKLFGGTVPNGIPQIVTWRLTGKSRTESRAFAWAEDRSTARKAEPKRRPIYLPLKNEYGEVPVYDRYALTPGTVLQAPLILEERESTLAIPSPATVTIMKDLTVSVVFGVSDAK